MAQPVNVLFVFMLNTKFSHIHPTWDKDQHWSALYMKIDRLQTRETVLGPVLFLCHIDDLPCSVTSQVRLFADNCLLYRTIRTQADHISLQNDLTELEKWVMCFNVWDPSDVGLQDELENIQKSSR